MIPRRSEDENRRVSNQLRQVLQVSLERCIANGYLAFGERSTSRRKHEGSFLEQNGAVEDGAAVAMDPSKPNSTQSTVEGRQIRAFAKLEFDDGPFYMNTYAVELGRDMRAARAAGRRKGSSGNRVSVSKRSSASVGDLPQRSSKRVKHETSGRYSMSLVSESGGVMGVDEPDPEDIRRWKRPSSGLSTRRNSSHDTKCSAEPESIDTQWLKKQTREEPKVDPFNLLPSPEECPLIPIHPPAISTETGGYRGISRKHVKIAYNFDRHVFELQIIGKNGAFVDDRWHASGESVALRSGAHVQVGGVSMRFVLPEVEEVVDVREEVGVGMAEENGDAMVVDDDDADRELNSGSDASSEAESDDEEMVEVDDGQDAEQQDEDEDEDEEDDDEEEQQPVEETQPELLKKRGPGRPPKHGRYMKKPTLEEPAATNNTPVGKPGRKPKPVPPPPTTEKRKVGRPRKHPLPEDSPAKPEKRKYVRRKGVEGSGDGGNEGKESGPAKEKKEPKPKRPPRSPSPVFDESKLTEQDLAKPQSSYVVLIHEALINSASGTLSLPQIYRAIERKYPYFKLRVTTNGWQSSVRHNLSQHDAFQKIERDGKGWVWGLVPGVSIEKEKRRKAVSPPVSQQQKLPTSTGQGIDPNMNTGLPLQGFAQPTRGIQPHQPLGAPPAQRAMPVGAPGNATNGGYHPSYNTPHQFHHPSINNQLHHQHGSFGNSLGTSLPNGTNNHITTPSGHGKNPGQPGPGPVKFNGIQQPSRSHPSPSSSGQILAPPPRPGRPSSTPVPVPVPVPTPAPTTSIPAPIIKPVQITPDLLNAVQSFKSALLKSMPKTAHSEIVVQSAIDRALGISNRSRLEGGGQEDPQELTVIRALSAIIHGSSSSVSPAVNANANGTANGNGTGTGTGTGFTMATANGSMR